MAKNIAGYGIAMLFGAVTVIGYNLLSEQPSPTSQQQHNVDTRQPAQPFTPRPPVKRPAVETDTGIVIGHSSSINELVNQSHLFTRLETAYHLAANADEAQLVSLLDEITLAEPNANMTTAARVFFLRYAELNPQAAMQKFQQLYDEPEPARKDIMYAMFHDWAMHDMTSALLFIANSIGKDNQEEILRFLIADEYFKDNAQLLDHANTYSDSLRAFVLMIQTKDQPIEVQFDALLALNLDDQALTGEMYPLLKRWAQDNPQQALQKLLSLDETEPRAKNWIDALFRRWLNVSPEDAVIAAMGLPKEYNYVEVVMTGLAYSDAQTAIEIYQRHSQKLGEKMHRTILNNWAAKDIDGALRYLEQLPPSQRAKLVKGSRVLWSYAKSSPAEAFEFAKANDLLGDRASLYTLASNMVKNDVKQAQSYWGSLEDGAAKDTLYSHITRTLAKKDVSSAIKWLNENNASKNGTLRAKAFLYSEWTKTDPLGAADDALSNSNDSDQAYAVSSMINAWYRNDREEAIKWASNLSSGATKDRALTSLIGQIARRDPDRAKQLLSQISDPKTREQLGQRFR